MALTANQKIKVRAALHRAYSKEELPTPWTKATADTAITETDGWLIDNAASYAGALSQPFKGASTGADKSVLLITTAIAQRLIDNPAHINVLRDVLAELIGIDEV